MRVGQTTLEDNELIMLAQQGDVIAFEQLVHRYDRKVLTIATAFMNNTEDAKDIYQEVFLRVFRALPEFRFESRFSTWLHRITTNVCLTQKSRKKRDQHESLDTGFEETGTDAVLAAAAPDQRTPDTEVISSEVEKQVIRAMDSLSERQRMVFTLKHFQGYKLREIASMMKCAEGTVKKYLFTANERLREQLKGVYP